MKLETGTATPLYQQLKEELKQAIQNGIYPYGQKIPTEPELSEYYNVSRITVRRAVQELCEEGFLIKKQGKGTFVRHAKVSRKISNLSSFTESCIQNNIKPGKIVVKRELISLSAEDAKAMQVHEGTPALYIQRISTGDGIPIMCENNLYPLPRLSFLYNEPLNESLYTLLKQKYQIIVSSSSNSYLDLIQANGEIAALLNVPNGEPLFYLYTQVYDQHNELIHIGKQYIVGKHYRFHLDLQRS